MIQKTYRTLEKRVPRRLKQLIPTKWRVRAGHQIKVAWERGVDNIEGLAYPLELPPGETERSLRDYLAQFQEDDALANADRVNYLDEAFKRFLYTLQLVPDGSGRALEVGAHPYFLSLLLRRFTTYKLHYINYFGKDYHDSSQRLIDSDKQQIEFDFANVNIEEQPLPYNDDAFEVALLCEVLEHFAKDPLWALMQIKRVLKPGGVFILTTPNVARLENVSRILAGQNLYDPYSGFGPYGRHNREYTVHELRQLLEHLGFSIEKIFTSDVHVNRANQYYGVDQFAELIQERQGQLGQYIFLQARNSRPVFSNKKPSWLYRNYQADELAD